MLKIDVTNRSEWFNRYEEALTSKLDDALTDVANQTLEAAQNLAPVDSGEYRDSLTVTLEDGEATIGSDSDHALIVEYGTAYQHGFNVLGEAANVAKKLLPTLTSEAIKDAGQMS